MQPEARTLKYFNIADKYDGKAHFQHQEIKNIANNKENLIHRIVLNEWRYVEYYVQEALNYCKKSRILTEAEIKELRLTRVERFQKADPQSSRSPYLASNSYSQNLTEAILSEQKSFVWLMKLFHRDYLDIQRSQPLSPQEHVDQSLFDFFNMNH